ncbi:hypothetical protein O3G_MSEX002114 [Manduca sexta]|uniref:Carboxylic ester hydrolase n=1 Tax=Manduca sexta TaxID=7130 RepID=A0A922CD99_MANSE|nr:hypothetical protein O3G_MSEX002114 [Manduca sexta]KAG6441953.1 hypothetical protein O3G_MSEX002114 [Manduca sexta]UXP71987.1 esterase [Manduca sexta]
MLRRIITIVAVISIVHAKNDRIPNYRNVMTEGGLVRGTRVESEEYFAFLGIPYAAQPTSYNRFKPPLPPLPWDGIYEANRTVKCPQRGKGDENCLVVNVFTPVKVPKNPLPVLVYIHGGSFLLGTGQTSGVGPLIKEDIIVVTMNYRLGVLGFLCLGIEEAPGNAGLKDQIAALLWVRNNINNFGGNPEDVTIYGMSAGGAAVEYQVLSKMGYGLFKQAIVESGAATSVWSFDANPIKTAIDMAQLLDFPNTTNVYEMIDYYRSVPAELISAMNYDYYNRLTDGTFGFVPCAEREIPYIEAFITESPYEILTKEKYNKIPMIFVFATLEGLFLRSSEFYEQNYKDRMQTKFLDFLPADLVFDTCEIKQDIATNIKHFYFGNKTIGDDTIIEYLNYFGDSLVLNAFFNSAEIHSKSNPVYLMEFAYKGGMGSYEEFYKNINIAGHGDVVKHVFLNKPINDESDKLAVGRMAKLIANFVKFGNPTTCRTELLPILWPPIQPNNVTCLHFDRDLQIIEEPYWDRKTFWDQLYAKFRRPTSFDKS